MKHFAILCVATLLSLATLTSCGDRDTIITVDQLPVAAQTYLKQNYADRSILFAKKDAELFNTTYKVHLDGGLELEFNKDGQLKDMEIDN